MLTRTRTLPPKRYQPAEYAERRAVLREQLPYVALIRSPERPSSASSTISDVFDVATYNVHRWTGIAGGRRWSPELATDVIAELDADFIGLQEVLRPFDADDPLVYISDALGLHLTFVSTRVHRLGELGNAILSRWPPASIYTIDLSLSRLERRSAVVCEIRGEDASVAVVATHLALVDRTRKRQVRSILESEQLQRCTVLMGDMNAWRRCPATRRLEREFTMMHHNTNWPASFPAARPVLALDRIYARGAHVISLRSHSTTSSRRASDHLPVIATIEQDGT